MARLYALLVHAAIVAHVFSAGIEFTYNKKLEADVLKGYNNKHRPVKSEGTSVQVQIFISITHVEKVDEAEQTMMVHGHLWATWTDEYLVWNAADYNNTDKLNIDAWRIWQPALALYNSARGNAWYLYMNGMPAVVSSTGKVWASGAFSFYVTCRFDFSEWPYDTQDCPIVISDWVYDLSRVNLSDPGEIPWKNPLVKLNYDPQTAIEKKHVSGWEVSDTWRKHCYWGPTGCKEDMPEGQPEWYWSLLEFGVRLKRHAPYLGVIVILPTVVSSGINLLTFWIDTWGTAIGLILANIMLQGIFGWDLIRELPPGSGGIPRVVLLYGINLALTAFTFILHATLNYILYVTPPDVTFPVQISTLPQKLGLKKFFDAKGLSFDPQTILQAEREAEETENYHSPLASIQSSNALEHPTENDTETLIPMNEASHPSEEAPTDGQGADFNIPIDDEEVTEVRHEAPKPQEEEVNQSRLTAQLYCVRRMFFCVYAVIYLILIPYGIF